MVKTNFWGTQQTQQASMVIQQTESKSLTLALQNRELLEIGHFSCQKRQRNKSVERHLGIMCH